MYHFDPADLEINNCVNSNCYIRNLESYPSEFHASTENNITHKMKIYQSHHAIITPMKDSFPGEFIHTNNKTITNKTVKELALASGMIDNPQVFDNIKIITQKVYSLYKLPEILKELEKNSIIEFYSFALKDKKFNISPEMREVFNQKKRAKEEISDDDILDIYYSHKNEITHRLMLPQKIDFDNALKIFVQQHEVLSGLSKLDVFKTIWDTPELLHNYSMRVIQESYNNFYFRAYEEGFIVDYRVERDMEEKWVKNKSLAKNNAYSNSPDALVFKEYLMKRGRSAVTKNSYAKFFLDKLYKENKQFIIDNIYDRISSICNSNDTII